MMEFTRQIVNLINIYFLQDAVQGWHWANAQCTIHPFAVYFKDENDELHEQSLLIIAESPKHNYDAVYQFQLLLIEYLKERFPIINRIAFFSDGAGGQYKNKKNFFQLCQFKAIHGFDAEWHFFATSHGKGPCDGIGGTFKRNAAKASLQRPYTNQITNARDLFTWAISTDSAIVFRFCSEADYNRIERHLRNKFNDINGITGTRMYHSFVPINDKTIQVRRFSECENFENFVLKN